MCSEMCLFLASSLTEEESSRIFPVQSLSKLLIDRILILMIIYSASGIIQIGATVRHLLVMVYLSCISTGRTGAGECGVTHGCFLF